jgi:hypothetical protein
MTKDSKTQSIKKGSSSKKRDSKKIEEVSRRRKTHEESDDDEGDGSHSSEDEEEDDMNVHEYRKLLSTIFPSKHLNKKIKAGPGIYSREY